MQDQVNKITELENEYNENYESKRIVQDQMYEEFVATRRDLYKKWVTSASKDVLYEMINMKFDYTPIPDIFVRRDISNNKQPKAIANPPDVSKPVPKAAPKETVNKVVKPKPVPKAAALKATQQKDTKKCGIQNLGNSCYINSTLQYLIHLPKFNEIIKKHSDSENNVVKAYMNLYETYMNKNVDEQTILELVNKLNVSLNEYDKFDVTQQSDASEFMLKLLDKMNIEDLSNLFEVKMQTRKEFDKTMKKGKKELQCNEKKDVTETKEETIILKFVDKKAVYNVNTELTKAYDGIKEEVDKKAEFLDCNNVVETITEKAHTKAEKFPYTRTEQVTSFPQVLKVSYNIFDKKLNKIFIKSEIPNIWEYKDNKYKLNGIIVHIGSSMSSGHYEYYSYEDGKWYEYSDSIVKQYKTSKPLKTGHYILSDDENENNIFYTNKSQPCPYLLSYIKM
jgi:ubiquitin C-terminal hydrolase